MPRCPLCHRRVAAAARCPGDGWTPPSHTPEAVGPASDAAPPAIAGLEIGVRIGAGGFAEVWEARRGGESAALALKVARADHLLARERFRREADALARVGPPHAPRLDDHGLLSDGRPYLVMERLAGRTLAAWIEARSSPLDLEAAAEIADWVLAALGATHARGVVHRDLKPENVFLDERQKHATLLDFGLASQVAAAASSRAGFVAGTSEYMAPEQIRGAPEPDARADLYAMGAILFEMLALRPPFVGDRAEIEHAHLALRPPPLRSFAQVPQAVEEIVLSCLAKEPERRPPDADALRRALREACERGPSFRPPGPRRSPSDRPRPPVIAEGRRPFVVLVADTGATAAAVVAAVAARQGFVARQRGRRYVAVFSSADADAPIEAASAAAHELVEQHGARAALHLAPLRVRHAPDGLPAIYGAAIERPVTWLPAEDWSGVVLSPELARVAAASALAPHPPLVGRDDVLATLGGSLATCLGVARPALVTILGDPGLGKSRLLVEAAAIFGQRCPDGRVIALQAAQPASGGAAEAGRALLAELGDEAPFPPPGRERLRAIASALRAAAARGPCAVLLDDAHWADDALLDALEYATLDAERCPLWVVLAARPRLGAVRPGWGARAERHDRIALAPLDEASGMELAAALLAPAEYPPADALRRLHGWAGGNPSCLAEIARALVDAGFVRRRRRTGSHYLSTSELDRLPPSTAWQWLAARQLDALPAELSACARLCSVLGADFTRDDVERIQDALERAGAAGTPIDAGVGLEALAHRGVLVRLAEGRYSFESATLQEAVHELLDAGHRAQIHRAAFERWRAEVRLDALPARLEPADRDACERLARHAAAVGATDEAAAAHHALADLAARCHEHVAADEHYTAALALAASDEEGCARRAGLRPRAPAGAGRRARALAGRGKVRYRILREREAIEDLAAARELAAAAGDDALAAELLLEESTALDWANEFAASAERVEAARPLVDRLDDPRLAYAFRIAAGRSAWRHGRVAEAIELFDRGAAEADAHGDYDAAIVALLLLPCALVVAGRLDEAEARFDASIARAAAAEDWVHLCAAYGNRLFLWVARKAWERGLEDLRRAMELAREVGNPWPERAATINLAELLYWSGREDEALPLARRARVLEERFMERPVHESSLLLARLHALRGDEEEAARLLDWIAAHCPIDRSAPNAEAQYAALRLAVGAGQDEAAWARILAQADELLEEERLELLYWRARAALRRGRSEASERALRDVRAALAGSAVWRARLERVLAPATGP